MIIENYLEMKTPMSIYYIIGIVVCVVIIGTVLYFIGKNLDERKRTTNIELPDLEEIEQQERIKRMERNKDDYDFKAQRINPSKIAISEDEDEDNGKYISKKATEFNVDEFEGLLAGTEHIPNVVGDISLPDLESASNAPKKPSKDDIVPPSINIPKKSESLTEQSGDNESNVDQDTSSEDATETEDKSDTQEQGIGSEFTLPEI